MKLLVSLLLILTFSKYSLPQAMMPFVPQQFLDNNGNPVSTGTITTYAAGTVTPLNTYSDSTLMTANPNPITLNAAGRPSVDGTEVHMYLSADSYKFVLKNSAGTTIWTRDNVTNYLGSGGLFSITGDIRATDQLISLASTGTAPLTVSSTTPVTNLTTVPTTYNKSGTQQTNVHLVFGRDALSGGTATITLTGSAAFTSNSTYRCIVGAEGTANASYVTLDSGSQFTLTGTGTDNIAWICVGN